MENKTIILRRAGQYGQQSFFFVCVLSADIQCISLYFLLFSI